MGYRISDDMLDSVELAIGSATMEKAKSKHSDLNLEAYSKLNPKKKK